MRTLNGVVQPGGTVLADANYWLDDKYPNRTSEETLLSDAPVIFIALRYEGAMKTKQQEIAARIRAESAANAPIPDRAVELAIRRWIDREAARLGLRLLHEYWNDSHDPGIRADENDSMGSPSQRSRITMHTQYLRHATHNLERAEKEYANAVRDLTRIVGTAHPSEAERVIETALSSVESLRPQQSTPIAPQPRHPPR